MNALTSSGLHPAGEEVFEFPTYAGKVTISPTDDLLTPYGGLVPFAAFLRHTGLIERLAQSCPIERTSPNASPIRDVLVSFLLTALYEGKRFSHVERFREDPTMGELLGIKEVVSDDTIRRLFRQIDQGSGRSWVEQSMNQALESLKSRRVWLNRGDIGFGQESVLAWHEQAASAPRYLFKLKFTRGLRRALSQIKQEDWQGPAQHGVLQVAEVQIQLDGWMAKRRVVVGRRLLLLTYNLWNLFLRLMRPEKHLEAITGRKWFLLIAARLTKSSRQRSMQIAVGGAWWEELKDGYQRICQWISSTAPQLKIPEQKIADFSFLAPAGA